MKRAELEHVLRAAGAITGVTRWVVVGSQAILGSVPDPPEELLVSQEADVYAIDSDDASDLVDGSIGERSPFHDSFGYYAHGVGPGTAILPERWRERAVTVESPATGGVTGICPSAADLAISKLAAGREKDLGYVRSLIRHGIVAAAELRRLLPELRADVREQVEARLRSVSNSAAS